MEKAIVFDCDGVLADTERYGHLPAFNRMWKEFGVSWQWTETEYGRKLAIGGGKERMATLFEAPEFLSVFKPPPSQEKRQELLSAWHRRKSEIYREIVSNGLIPPRPGIRRLALEALDRGWRLAVASTSAKESVDAVIRHVLGQEIQARLSIVLAGDVVKAKKPAPDVYLMVLDRLGVTGNQCVAVEDTRNGMLAAVGAGMKCVVTVSDYTRKENFAEASLVITCLGEPEGETCRVLENRSRTVIGNCITVTDLDDILGLN